MTEDSLAEAIAYELRREILRGNLPPGATIKERDNAERQGVSRTPMREAIRILAKEGLVQLRPLRSPIVADPSLAEIIDQIRVLHALELLSGELACEKATEGEISAIGALKDRIEEIYGEADTLDVFELDMQFHSAIVAASHNAALAETHASYMARLWRARYLSARRKLSRGRVLRQHKAIHAALHARDVAAIKAEIGAHLGAMIANIEDHFREETDEGQD
ncbi:MULTISPECIES: GntR family transcriptional regulator [Paracoccus]|uniref:FCD domain-containing protein n=1 Tax=Paracoccus litorisediminis TaxID=2006130 RepID=A0A844HGP9_9RHOB|nr:MULTISPECIES: GntR family transcriptional regulator [Paracoccus]MBD9528153.1 GntR family transcriptional regulator [Paracoccus sp. PAR01]MTH59143.1 FCD domain-containing protein [Paracoccus litorisediminis]